MRKRISLPGQLALNFESSSKYLSWIELKGEKYEEYETTTLKLIAAPIREELNSSIWHEIVYALNR
jgi:hypothetical protein